MEDLEQIDNPKTTFVAKGKTLAEASDFLNQLREKLEAPVRRCKNLSMPILISLYLLLLI